MPKTGTKFYKWQHNQIVRKLMVWMLKSQRRLKRMKGEPYGVTDKIDSRDALRKKYKQERQKNA